MLQFKLDFFAQDDAYRSLARPVEAEYKVKHSRFLAYAYPVADEGEVKAILEVLRKQHFKATHHCYAYRLDLSGQLFRANDDGEPSGTAGKPILGQIDRLGLRFVLVVVVRYYGGIKLGVGGLREAYKLAAAMALDQAEIVDKILEQRLYLGLSYTQLSDWMAWLKEAGYPVLDSKYEAERVQLLTQVRLGELPRLIEKAEAEGLDLSLPPASAD